MDTYHAVTTAVAGFFAALTAADHALAAAEKFVPNSAWQFIKAVVFKQPIKAQPQETAGGGTVNLLHLEEYVGKIEGLASRLAGAAGTIAKAAEVLAPIAKMVAPMTGAAPAVLAGAEATEVLAPMVEKSAEILQQSLAKQTGDNPDHVHQ